MRSEGPAGSRTTVQPFNRPTASSWATLACVVPPIRIRSMYLRTSPALEAYSRAGCAAARYPLWTPQEKRPLQESRSSRARFSTNNHRTSTGLWLTSEASMAASLYHCMAAPLRRCINAHSMLHACSHRGPPQSQQRPAAGAQAKRAARKIPTSTRPNLELLSVLAQCSVCAVLGPGLRSFSLSLAPALAALAALPVSTLQPAQPSPSPGKQESKKGQKLGRARA